MADYRELLRKAIDALPENTGANRRAVYEKARSALVAQLRAIEPPLPAREITTHRLNLEDCIREVEHEATEKLLGRFRAVEAEPESEPEIVPVAEEEPEERVEPGFGYEESPAADAADQGEPEIAEAEEVEPDVFEAPPAEALEPDEPVEAYESEPAEAEAVEPESEPVVVTPDWREEDESPAPAGEDDRFDAFEERDALSLAPEDEPRVKEAAAEDDHPPAAEPAPYQPGSIEDIIASAERAAHDSEPQGADETEAEETPTLEADDRRVIPLSRDFEPRMGGESEKHFITSPADAEPHAPVSLVDLHGRPLGGADHAPAEPGTAMSSVREVDLEPGILARPEISDAQVAIDRAIAALDREARGETSEVEEASQAPAEEPAAPGEAGEERAERSGGFGAFTIFLIISILLLGGGGLAGFWAWREGYIDLNALFAQSEAGQPATEVAEAELPETPQEPAAAETPAEMPATNTTPEVPATSGEVEAVTTPGETPSFTETETPSNTLGEPEASFEDRLPAEAETPVEPDAEMLEQPGIALSTEGPQSLLLEEQSNGQTGAVPYSGSVEWSRGTDELGHPTIIANASIPARNLEVEVLLRRNADANLPASHLMEVNFDVAESFIGGSIANLPGVLLKDEELVQGQPLTGASARIVGNSFLFALSSASDIDVENNLELLTERAWLDLAMVYGTGRRAILTLEKGEEGAAIFEDVMAAWAELDAAAAAEAPAEEEAASAAEEQGAGA